MAIRPKSIVILLFKINDLEMCAEACNFIFTIGAVVSCTELKNSLTSISPKNMKRGN